MSGTMNISILNFTINISMINVQERSLNLGLYHNAGHKISFISSKQKL